ncbi:HIT family protein [Patescibacteria group bacterium]|nr:HIT family protein [Patescibacteria group bacterium]MBU1906810.1 HIT family protein [Patescibacteria group bacterium]
MPDDCIFCKIVNKEIPGDIVYEDDDVLAFMDIYPTSEAHTLVIPKVHSENILETSPELAGKIINVVQKIAPAVMKSAGMPACVISNNCGKEAGQIIFHTHVHILPRAEGDGKQMWGPIETTPEQISANAQKIREALNS